MAERMPGVCWPDQVVELVSSGVQRETLSQRLRREQPLASACAHMHVCALSRCLVPRYIVMVALENPYRHWGTPRKQRKCKGVLPEEFGAGRLLSSLSVPITRHSMVPEEQQVWGSQALRELPVQGWDAHIAGSLPQFLPP